MGKRGNGVGPLCVYRRLSLHPGLCGYFKHIVMFNPYNQELTLSPFYICGKLVTECIQ